MNIYKISQEANTGYDTYDSAIVAAETEEDARNISPDGGDWKIRWGYWCQFPHQVEVELIGTAKDGTEAGVILASFNAG